MKNMFSSKEAFSAYARIDANNFALTKTLHKLNQIRIQSHVDQLIDYHTGEMKEQLINLYDGAISCMTSIIEDKVFIEADAENDRSKLIRLKELKDEMFKITVEQ